MTSAGRTRQPHRKVRTGCLTCKTRRKKCDEEKPFCRRCATSGFTCDGYAEITIFATTLPIPNDVSRPPDGCLYARQPQPATSERSPSDGTNETPSSQNEFSPTDPDQQWRTLRILPSSESSEEPLKHDGGFDLKRECQQGHDFTLVSTTPSSVSLLRSPNALAELHQISDLEQHCYSYVRYHTVPRFAAYFEHFIWRIDLQDASSLAYHPALFKAVTALGAVHRRFCYGISRKAFEYCAHASRLYEDALRALNTLKRSTGSRLDMHTMHVISTCETILGIFQAFQANPKASAEHLRSGIRASISSPSKLLHTQSFPYARPSPPRIICGMLYQLYCQATEIFGEPALTYAIYRTEPHTDLATPSRFASIGEMKDHLFALIEEVWRHFRWVEDSTGNFKTLKPYECVLSRWISACLSALDSGLQITPSQIKAFNVLNLTRCVLSLCIQGNILKTDEHEIEHLPHLPIFRSSTDHDDLSEATAELCRAIDHMYRINDSDLSSIRTMFEQTLVKHKIFSFEQLSTSGAPSQGVHELVNVWTIAKQVGEAQEDALIEVVKDVIPSNAMYVDIGDVWREKRKVMVRYYQPDHFHGNYRWVSQFWSY